MAIAAVPHRADRSESYILATVSQLSLVFRSFMLGRNYALVKRTPLHLGIALTSANCKCAGLLAFYKAKPLSKSAKYC